MSFREPIAKPHRIKPAHLVYGTIVCTFFIHRSVLESAWILSHYLMVLFLSDRVLPHRERTYADAMP